MASRLGWFGLGATAVLLVAPPLAAQTGPAQTVPAAPPASAAADPPLDPNAPLAPLPDIGVAWPDLGTGTATTNVVQTTDGAAETRYAWRIDGIDAAATPLLRQRFDELSTLSANDRSAANAAQLDRRAREDADLLQTLLRGEGYYDARVTTRVEPGAKPLVVLAAEPGTLYRFRDVTLGGIAAADGKAPALRDAFGVKADDPVNADAIVAGEARLKTQIGQAGFPFADVGESQIVVDRAAKTATLALAVAPGGARRFGQVVALPGNRVFDADHVQDIARFAPGDPYDAASLDDLRRALIQTGLVSSVEVKPVESATPGAVDIGVKLEPAPPRTIAGELGYGTGEGARSEISWTHRNLFPPEGGLTLRGVLGTREQLGNIVFRRNNVNGRDRVLTAQLAASHVVRDAYEAKTFTLAGGLERQTTIFFQKAWTWSLGGELLASDERDVIAATGEPRRRTFFIAATPTSLNYDGSDDLLNPTRGFRLGGRFSPEFSLQGSAFGYARLQVDGSAYQPVSPRVVLAERVRLGSILGAPRDRIAPSRRFYAGGGASVRGYGYQAIGPRDVNNDPIGGLSLAEFSIEARVKTFGNFGIVPFLDGGTIYTSALPRLSDFQYGAGVGVRYYSNFGPIRLDVGTPLNPQPGDSRIAVYVSLGQAF
ncbi:autotransporter assembly complex protein TamA [Sphingomonas sp. RP10(2022)]|uniref:Autotransporter assembly complex protein TamA n=1 Tax=Sphingomonas liriopis TaxID=2949094 RepID=A0A9X2KPI0_9SPHN|nr:autotransporter assembly complex family protein [Sphingomonas liriopis]MCP3733902.1 autotransporter assembly complex protein TamA [Sphingomonas liriopis]